MKHKFTWCSFTLFIVFQVSFSQKMTSLEILSKVEDYYKKTKTIDLDINYNMYRGYDGSKITESYDGHIYKNENVTQINILGSEILQFAEAQITINKTEKTLRYISKTQNASTQNSPIDMSAYLTLFKESSIKAVNNKIIIEMVKKSKNTPIAYNRIIIHINKKNHNIEKQVLYFSTKVPFLDDNGEYIDDYGRLEINFKESLNPLMKDIKFKDYIVLGANNQLKTATDFKTYTIIDQSKL